MLAAMGFTANAAKRGLIKYKNDLEAASNWIMENMDNYEINLPLEEESKPKAPSFSQDAVNQIMDFGFSLEQAKVALLKNVIIFLTQEHSPEAAIEWLCNNDGDVSPYLNLLAAEKKEESKEYEKPAYSNY